MEIFPPRGPHFRIEPIETELFCGPHLNFESRFFLFLEGTFFNRIEMTDNSYVTATEQVEQSVTFGRDVTCVKFGPVVEGAVIEAG